MNPAGWGLSRRAADAPAGAPWEALVRAAPAREDALAEALAPAAPPAPMDLLRLEGPDGEREHWFVRDDGRTVRLPNLAYVPTEPGPDGEAAPLGGPFGGDDWAAAWHGEARGDRLLGWLARAGVAPDPLARAGLALVRARAEALGGPLPGATAALAFAAREMDRAGSGRRAIRHPDPRIGATGEDADLGCAAERCALVARGNKGPAWAAALLGEVSRECAGRAPDGGPDPADLARQADAVRARIPLGALLLAATEPGRFSAHADEVDLRLARYWRSDTRVHLAVGDPATGEDFNAPASGWVGRTGGDGPRGWLLAPRVRGLGGTPVDPARVVRMLAGDRREVFRHPAYHRAEPVVLDLDVILARWPVRRFRSPAALARWLAFAAGERMAP